MSRNPKRYFLVNIGISAGYSIKLQAVLRPRGTDRYIHLNRYTSIRRRGSSWMRNTKKILVIALMVVLVSSVVAGAISFYSRPSTTNDNKMLLNARLNSVVNFCTQSLPNGTAVCDGQLAAAVNKICEENKGQMSLDACHDGKVDLYYKNRNIEIAKRNTVIKNNSNNTVKGTSSIIPRK